MAPGPAGRTGASRPPGGGGRDARCARGWGAPARVAPCRAPGGTGWVPLGRRRPGVAERARSGRAAGRGDAGPWMGITMC